MALGMKTGPWQGRRQSQGCPVKTKTLQSPFRFPETFQRPAGWGGETGTCLPVSCW